MTNPNPDPGQKRFFCEKYSCKISAKACICRQIKKNNWGGYASNNNQNKINYLFTYPECAKCKQGKYILAEYQKLMRKEDN